MLVQFLILIVSLVFLVWSADKFVFGASSIARNYGISPMVIGLTIVAMGSSAPEMMVAATASFQGSPNTAIGNAIGSNITNIALVLGVTALLAPLKVSSNTIKKELPLILAITILACYVLWDQHFSFIEGAVLLVLFFVYIFGLLFMTIRRKKQAKENEEEDLLITEAEADVPEAVSKPLSFLWLIVGLIVLPLSAGYLVESATEIAKAFGVSDLIIGLTIIAIGTSLPELAASIASIIKKEDDLALGNIIGSNIFNILAVLSLAGVIAPGEIDAQAATRDAPIMLAITLLLFALCFSRIKGAFRVTRLKGAVLLTCFIGYQALLFS
ncbi:sodium:calcium antiporter [Thalassotalea loyana]|uniref:Sodium:calcium antiporter n=1 Tax=Thalassotalea loyana TaxID=280483 RepID=A0ABQ6H8E5_9GAMM|nr:calcium/sodium antiporter [Thalassotalea loyana]GLX84403.1 sodium:calcium antiporter [Thalassotalea loyana]